MLISEAMDANREPRAKFTSLLSQSISFYFVKARIFGGILLFPAVVISLASISLVSLILGFSANGSEIDPTMFQFSISPWQWIFVGAAVLAMAVTTSLSMAATVHATIQRGSAGIFGAFAAIDAKPMQIFWLQCVIYALALRFSPWTVLLFWLLVAFAIPAALRENMGPSDAMERAWSLSRGHRLAILGIELLLLVPPFLATILGGLLGGPDGVLYAVSPIIRAASSWLMILLLLAPIQFMFVAITWIYQKLASEPESTLHTRAASNVNP